MPFIGNLGTPVTATLNFLAGFDPNENPRNPIVWLSWSNDGGHTWSDEIQMNLGQVGQYMYRCRALRLGRARDRVYQIRYADTAPLRIVDAYLKASGYPIVQRLPDKLRQQA